MQTRLSFWQLATTTPHYMLYTFQLLFQSKVGCSLQTPGGGGVCLQTPGGGGVRLQTPRGGGVRLQTPEGGGVCLQTPRGGGVCLQTPNLLYMCRSSHCHVSPLGSSFPPQLRPTRCQDDLYSPVLPPPLLSHIYVLLEYGRKQTFTLPMNDTYMHCETFSSINVLRR